MSGQNIRAYNANQQPPSRALLDTAMRSVVNATRGLPRSAPITTPHFQLQTKLL